MAKCESRPATQSHRLHRGIGAPTRGRGLLELLAWSRTAVQSWFRVSGWFQSRPHNVSGGFRMLHDASGCWV
jgi:hypothetical protein